MASNAPSIDSAQVALFGGLAEDWWNPRGSSALLHRINPVRLGYIRDRAVRHFGRDERARRVLDGLTALDVGCGGGVLCEPLARMGAQVTGLDAAAENIAVAKAHAATMGLGIAYRAGPVEEMDGVFDIVACLEVIEHVANLASFVEALADRLAPGGLLLFSTPNRTLLSKAVMITAAEDVLRIIPRGAHDWHRFRKPDELREAFGAAGLRVDDLRGLSYRPTRGFAISDDLSVNYIGSATRR